MKSRIIVYSWRNERVGDVEKSNIFEIAVLALRFEMNFGDQNGSKVEKKNSEKKMQEKNQHNFAQKKYEIVAFCYIKVYL